jgi:hypothetical protein
MLEKVNADVAADERSERERAAREAEAQQQHEETVREISSRLIFRVALVFAEASPSGISGRRSPAFRRSDVGLTARPTATISSLELPLLRRIIGRCSSLRPSRRHPLPLWAACTS